MHYLVLDKIKDTVRTFQAENHQKLRTSQAKKKFAGPYKKKECNTTFVPQIQVAIEKALRNALC